MKMRNMGMEQVEEKRWDSLHLLLAPRCALVAIADCHGEFEEAQASYSCMRVMVHGTLVSLQIRVTLFGLFLLFLILRICLCCT